MEASKQEAPRPRRKRFERCQEQGQRVQVTPRRLAILRYLAEQRVLTAKQLALLLPAPEKAIRGHTRALYDAGLLDVIAVSRLALTGSEAINDSSLLFGSAPNLYVLTRDGRNLLFEGGLISKEQRERQSPKYGPRNSFYLAHELAIRDVFVWLEQSRRIWESEPAQWHEAKEAYLTLPATQSTSACELHPDAWFQVGLGSLAPGRKLSAFVEVDRGTERGVTRWREKVLGYYGLFATPSLIPAVLGTTRTRVIVTVPDAVRRDSLAAQIGDITGESGIAQHFYLVVASDLSPSVWSAPLWQQPNQAALVPLLPPAITKGSLP
nr:replication-relaxation family protein [Armatimonas rosea]